MPTANRIGSGQVLSHRQKETISICQNSKTSGVGYARYRPLPTFFTPAIWANVLLTMFGRFALFVL